MTILSFPDTTEVNTGEAFVDAVFAILPLVYLIVLIGVTYRLLCLRNITEYK